MSAISKQLKKPWVVMPVVAAIALGSWWALRPDPSGSTTATTATEQVAEATVGTMAKTVSADGTITAADTEDLSFTSAGTVTAVHVAAGDTVTKGQVLAELDSAALEADVSSAEAALATAEAKLADDTDADASDAQLAADASSVTSAEDQLASANEALAGATLVAGIDATVASVDITVGEELAAGGTGGTGQTGSGSGSGSSAATLGSGATTPSVGSDTGDATSTADIALVSAGRFTVDLGFDATDVAQVEVGQVASVSLSTASTSGTGGFPGFGGFGGFPGGQAAQGGGADSDATTTTTAPQATSTDGGVTALVTSVGTVADASSGVATYPVTVSFRDTSGDFNVGATVTVAITYAEVADAVQVPALALSSSGGTSTVQVKADGRTETRTVTTGLTSGTMVQITDGLEAGESVVIALPGAGGARAGGAGGFTPPATPGGGS